MSVVYQPVDAGVAAATLLELAGGMAPEGPEYRGCQRGLLSS